jgi:pseudouridine synthase
VVEVVLHEGKNRQIRKMAESIGHKVLRLVRVGLGFLELGDLAPGAIRELTPEEWKRLIP